MVIKRHYGPVIVRATPAHHRMNRSIEDMSGRPVDIYLYCEFVGNRLAMKVLGHRLPLPRQTENGIQFGKYSNWLDFYYRPVLDQMGLRVKALKL